MDRKQARVVKEIIEEHDYSIDELKKIIKNKDQEYQAALQKKINYYENILALMPGHVYWLDRNNIYLGCNDIQAIQANLPSRHAIVGKKNSDLPWRGQEAEELDRINLGIMETGLPDSKIENATMADGEGVFFSQKVPLRDESNEVIGLLGISIDITELKKTEAALTIANELSEAANRAKIEFISNMSHDIRTPLSGVVGMSKLLEERLTHPEHKQFAHWINQSGEQLLSLLNGIMDIVSAEHLCDTDLVNNAFDLRQCIDDIIQLERPTTLLKQIALKVNLDDSIPQYILSDRAKLHRVLLNLLGNAIKFTQIGHIAIEVNRVKKDEAEFLRFKVTDTGIGISPEHQDKIFDRFFRASSSYQGIYAGYGVGLHIAQSYVKLLGGELNFVSQPSNGSTFYFDLPLQIAQQVKTSLDGFDDQPVDDEPLDGSKRIHTDKIPHLLLVEDNTIALRVVELITTQAGCQFTSALNAEDAILRIKSQEFDLIITDIGLPGMSGYDLTRWIRAHEASLNTRPVPIIGLTAHAQTKNQCLQSGMNDVYSKPCNIKIMKTILSRYISFKAPKPGTNLGYKSKTRDGLPDDDAQLFELEQFPLLDIEHAVARMGSKALLIDMLKLMLTQEIPKDQPLLMAAYQAQDWNAIEKLAHRMKGGAVYCGTFRMQYACQYIERYHRAGLAVLLDPLYHQLIKVLDETKQAIIDLI